MKSRGEKLLALILLFAWTAGASCFGQAGSRFEIFGGGSRCQAQLGTDLGRRPLSGWDAGAAVSIGQRFDVVAQVSGLYGAPEVDQLKVNTSFHSLLLGIGYRPLGARGISPFAQVLAGPTRIRGALEGFDETAQADMRLSLATGAGVDWRRDRKWGLRLVQADWFFTNSALFDGTVQRHFRISAGLLVHPFRD